jgi:predicted TIM-barrel fold metal-dependent hydrolase
MTQAGTLARPENKKTQKIWAHSGDSHFVEPKGLWQEILPKALADRMPKIEEVEQDGRPMERIQVDGQVFFFPVPKIAQKRADGKKSIAELSVEAAGAKDLSARIADLNQEGIWGEVVYSSAGLWEGMIQDRELIRRAAAAENEWKVREVQGIAKDRLIAVASLPMRDINDTVAEVKHAAEIGMYAVSMPTPALPNSRNFDESVPALNADYWEPLWQILEDTGLVAAFHIGGDASEHTMYRGPGGAILNYTNSTYSGQRAAMILVACGALDRHPKLKVLISEGGAAWVPFLADRMEEAYRQHNMFVRPKLSRSPKELLYTQVYCSFQHEASAIPALKACGYQNVMWGSDYPHLEGTFGHTQETLHELFDGEPDWVKQRITMGAFKELFPHVSSPPTS